MKKDMNNQDYWDIDTKYIIDTLNSYRFEYSDLYKFIEHFSVEQLAINLIFDYRKNKKAKRIFGRMKSLLSLSVYDFMKNPEIFHQYDKFGLSVANGKTAVYHQCYADIVMLTIKNKFYADCKEILPKDKEETLLFSLAKKYDYSPENPNIIKGILDKLCKSDDLL